MDWIFDNMFIIVIIVSGLIGFFKNNNDEQQKQNEKKRPAPRNPKPAVPFESSEKRAAERSVNRERQTPAVTRFEQQQKDQIERLSQKFGAISDTRIDDLTKQMSNESNLKEPTRESVIHKEKMKRQVVDNISAKGLVNGVMMSEILGAPRAKKPYRSILQDRIR